MYRLEAYVITCKSACVIFVLFPSLDYGSFNESNRVKVVKLFLFYAFNQ